jgi:hypothetical protein
MAYGPIPPPAQAAANEKNADDPVTVKAPFPSSQEKSLFFDPSD